MKQIKKKLALRYDTIKQLTAAHANRVNGGITGAGPCNPTVGPNCATRNNTCDFDCRMAPSMIDPTCVAQTGDTQCICGGSQP